MRILIATGFVLLILTVGKIATSIDASGSGSTQHASVHRFRPQIASRDLYLSDAGWKPLVGPNRSTQFAPEGNYPTRTSFIAFWQPVSGATGYHVDVATDPTFTNYVNGYRDVAAGNVTHLPVHRLVPGTTYYYRVRPDSVPLVSPETRIAVTSANAGLTINATFDSSITSNPNAAAVEAMINRAIAIYETLFTDPVTIEILFRYTTTAPDGHPLRPGATARSDNPFYIIPWDTYIAALRADAKTGNDAVANASLPGTALSSDIRPSSANGRAVGLDTPPAMFADGSVGNGGPYDGIVTLNSTAPFGFTRPVASNDFDAQRETEHEIDEVMGLGSAANTAYFHTQDLFSWSSPGIRNISPNGTRYFSINGGNTNIVNFNQDPNGDPGDWLSGPCPQAQPYVQNASDCTGQSSDVTAISPEGISLDVIGYDLSSQDGDVGNGNTAEGTVALASLTSGSFNTALGLQALFSNTNGFYNTGTGVNALYNNTGGAYNTADGLDALYSNTTGLVNTATGVNALFSNTTARFNTADGANALYSNTTGAYNTATGFDALYSNTIGLGNTANGDFALFTNTTGTFDTAYGVNALFSNTSGSQNTATGMDALLNNTTGGMNTADGLFALDSNTTGSGNTASGSGALFHNTTGVDNTATGDSALDSNTAGSNNIALGTGAGGNLTTGSNNIDIGNSGVAAEANTIRIGIAGTQSATFIAGISGATASGGAAVLVSSNGQLGTITSSRRFKQEIKPMDKASEAILALRPVTFRYKQEIDPKGIPQFGLVAEEVEQVNPDLVVRDAEGKVYTVRYEAVNAMLLNEFLKEHRNMEQLKATLLEQWKEMELLTATWKEQQAQIQKVSDQLAIVSPRRATQVVDNNQ